MAETPNYNLYLPGQGEEAWDDEMNQNLVTIDAALQALADIIEGAVYQINGVTYVAANAKWTGSAWNRVNTGAPAVRLTLNTTNGSLEIATAAAGANPITWTTIQAFSATGLDMKSKKVYNLATPTAATDAATKAYIDGLIAALKLSQIAIDANKNWNGKNITNVGQLQANSVTTTTCTLIPDPCILYRDNRTITIESSSYTVLKTVTVPTGVSGTVAVHWDIDTRSSSRVTRSQLRKNGSVIRECHLSSNNYWEGFEYVAVTPGDVISLAFYIIGESDNGAKNNKFEIRAIPLPGPVAQLSW